MSTFVDSTTLLFPTVSDSEESFLTLLPVPILTLLPSNSESKIIDSLDSASTLTFLANSNPNSISKTSHLNLVPTHTHGVPSIMDPTSSSSSSSSFLNPTIESNQDSGGFNLNFWIPIMAAAGGAFLFFSLGLIFALVYRKRKQRKQSRIIQSVHPASHPSLHKKVSNFSIIQRHRYEMQFNLPMDEDVSSTTSSSSFPRYPHGKRKEAQKEKKPNFKHAFMNVTSFDSMLRPSPSLTDLNASHSTNSNPTCSTTSTFTNGTHLNENGSSKSQSHSSIKTRMAMEPNHVVVLHKCIWKLVRQYIASTFWSKTVWILFEFGTLLTHPQNLSKYVWAHQAKTPLEIFQYVFQVCCQPLQFQYHRPLSEQIRISDAFQQTFQKEWGHALQLLLKEAHAPITHAMVLLHCYVYYLFHTKSCKPNIFWMQDKSVCSLQQLAKVNDSEPIWPGLFQLSKEDPNGYVCICPPLNEHDESI